MCIRDSLHCLLLNVKADVSTSNGDVHARSRGSLCRRQSSSGGQRPKRPLNRVIKSKFVETSKKIKRKSRFRRLMILWLRNDKVTRSFFSRICKFPTVRSCAEKRPFLEAPNRVPENVEFDFWYARSSHRTMQYNQKQVSASLGLTQYHVRGRGKKIGSIP